MPPRTIFAIYSKLVGRVKSIAAAVTSKVEGPVVHLSSSIFPHPLAAAKP
jgi:hypothetical protein